MNYLKERAIKQALKGRSFLTLLDYTPDEIRYLLKLAHKLKTESYTKKHSKRFKGMNLALIFEKRSTRTRCAFETAFSEEAGHPVFLSTADIQLGVKESISDTAKVLGRMFDAIEFRGYKQSTVETLAKEAMIPVYNGLTDEFHPTQVLADLMTVEEAFGDLNSKKIVFVGDGRNNVATSLMIGCAKLGIDFTIVAPKELFPNQKIVSISKAIAKESQATIEITSSIETGVLNADVIYTDVWASMGEEEQAQRKEKLLNPYQVNEELMKMTKKSSTIFLHCLPAVKEQEVTTAVFESPQSWVFEEAENRKHTIKAIMVATLAR